MERDWPFLAMIGGAIASGATAAAGTLGTAATSALGGLGSLAAGAAHGIGTAASGALNAVTGGGGAGPTAASAAPAAAPAAAAPASGGGFLDNLLGRGPANQIGVSTPGGPMAVPPGAENLSQAVPYQGSLPGTPVLDQLGSGLKQMAAGRFGVTNPDMGVLDMVKQGGLSQLSGGPFVGYNPQASFLSNLGGAVRQRLLSQLSPDPGTQNQNPYALQQAVQLALSRQGPYARQLPVYGNLPGYG